jgi:hypothetical protein
MTAQKFANYIVRKPLHEDMPNDNTGGENNPGVTATETFMSAVQVEGAPLHISWGIIYEVPKFPDYITPHDHPYNEVLFFSGFNPENTLDLGGAVELQLGDETHMIDSTCCVYIPAGTMHCPLNVVRVDRPFGLAAVCVNGRYETMGYTTPDEIAAGAES